MRIGGFFPSVIMK